MTKWELDRRKYPTDIERHRAAVRYGALTIGYMLVCKDGNDGWITESGLDRAEEDAVMFAKMAYRGWRALQQAQHELN